MTPSDLEIVGRLLYGSHWQTSLAQNLGVSSRLVRYWIQGTNKITPVYEEKIRFLMHRHANFIRIILSNLESNTKKDFLELGTNR